MIGLGQSAIQTAGATEDHENSEHSDDKIDYAADLFMFGGGIFAALLSALSLNAYKNLKTKRLLLVSIAFAIFSVHAIVSKLDLFTLKLESSTLELVLAVLTFIALALFFLAIVTRERIKTRTTTDPSTQN